MRAPLLSNSRSQFSHRITSNGAFGSSRSDLGSGSAGGTSSTGGSGRKSAGFRLQIFACVLIDPGPKKLFPQLNSHSNGLIPGINVILKVILPST